MRYRSGAVAATLIAICALSASPADAAQIDNTLPRADGVTADGRGYERVSPADKAGLDVRPRGQASADGSQMLFTVWGAIQGSPSASIFNGYRATRGSVGWDGGVPETLPTPKVATPFGPSDLIAYTGDVGGPALFLSAQPLTPDAPDLTPEGIPSVPGSWLSGFNLYVRRADGTLAVVSGTDAQLPTDPNVRAFYGPQLVGASQDAAHVVTQTYVALTPGTVALPYGPNLYDYTGGTLHDVGILPDGTVAPAGATAGNGGVGPPTAQQGTAVSRDGSRIFFTASPDGVQASALYVRENSGAADASTVLVSRSQRTDDDPLASQPATFVQAATDGSSVLFTSTALLTNASTGADVKLYRYDFATGDLEDLTAAANDGGIPVNGIWGASDDLSTVYFPTTSGETYVWKNGNVDPVAPISVGSGVQVTPDGQHALIVTTTPLTDYDNTSATTGAPVSEVYRYDAPSNTISCASCDPQGRAPQDGAMLHVPTAAEADLALHNRRYISDDGSRIFFVSKDGLVPGSGGTGYFRVYESSGGKITMLSRGDSDGSDSFVDASSSGNDVFIDTRGRLTQADTDNLYDIYDVRVGGGDPPLAQQPVCSGDGCQARTAAPTLDGPVNAQGPSSALEPAPAPLRVGALSTSALRALAAGKTVTMTATGGYGTVHAIGRARVRGTVRSVITASGPVPTSGSTRLTLKLSSTGRSELRRVRKLKIRLSLTAGGGVAARTFTLTSTSSKKGR